MPMLNFHPAPGLGDLVPGWHVVPQNPLRPDSTILVPSVQAASGNRITKKPTIGELLPGRFTVPDNPVKKGLHMGMGGLGCGCGCTSGPPAYGLSGLSMDGTGLMGTGLFAGGTDLSTWGAGEYVTVGIGAYALYSLFSTGKRHAGTVRRKASAAYRTNPKRRNIEQGFWRGGRFHPIRASDDYEPDTVGERYQYAPKKKKRSKR